MFNLRNSILFHLVIYAAFYFAEGVDLTWHSQGLEAGSRFIRMIEKDATLSNGDKIWFNRVEVSGSTSGDGSKLTRAFALGKPTKVWPGSDKPLPVLTIDKAPLTKDILKKSIKNFHAKKSINDPKAQIMLLVQTDQTKRQMWTSDGMAYLTKKMKGVKVIATNQNVDKTAGAAYGSSNPSLTFIVGMEKMASPNKKAARVAFVNVWPQQNLFNIAAVMIAEGKDLKKMMKFPHFLSSSVYLSHPFDLANPSWPGNPKPVVTSSSLAFEEHTYTHMDAPGHFIPKSKPSGLWKTATIPTDRFFGPCHRLNFGKQAARNANFEVTAADVKNWEKANGNIDRGSIVLMDFDWSKKFGNVNQYRNFEPAIRPGTPESSLVASDMDFPGLSADAAEHLVRNRSVAGVGVDTLSVDPGNSKFYPVHIEFSRANVYGLENMARLGEMSPRFKYHCAVVPFKMGQSSGSPIAVIAMPTAYSHAARTVVLSVITSVGMTVLHGIFTFSL